ncbi:MAG: YbeD family protein [Burkholderiaceae bacterium]
MTEPIDPPVTPAESARATLIEFPCAFPIKVMGHKVDDFVSTLTTIAQEFDPQFDATSIELRQSKAGNYLGVTLNVWATSQAQLDALYMTLSSHPLVKVVL